MSMKLKVCISNSSIGISITTSSALLFRSVHLDIIRKEIQDLIGPGIGNQLADIIILL